jgi:hypothetical protein
MALPPFVGPWPLHQLRDLFTQTAGLLGRVISSSQGGQHKHRINAHTDIHTLSGIRMHDPSVPANEDSLCLRQRGYCDRLRLFYSEELLNKPIGYPVWRAIRQSSRCYAQLQRRQKLTGGMFKYLQLYWRLGVFSISLERKRGAYRHRIANYDEIEIEL